MYTYVCTYTFLFLLRLTSITAYKLFNMFPFYRPKWDAFMRVTDSRKIRFSNYFHSDM